MTEQKQNLSGHDTDLSLSTLCRFLAARLCYRFSLLLLFGTGIVLSLFQRSQFAPYGIALLCLLFPLYINSSTERAKKENSDSVLSVLYKRYHYSPVSFLNYRRMQSLCILLLIVWHSLQSPAITLGYISLPLLYAAILLAGYPVLSRILTFIFHRRLMSGTM